MKIIFIVTAKKIGRLLSTLMLHMALTGYFGNESLAIMVFGSQNNTINGEITYSNQSKIMEICKKCVKSIQAYEQNVQHENSTYESYTISIIPTHFNRRSKKSDGISNNLNYKSKSQSMSSLSHYSYKNRSKSIFKIIKEDNNFIIEWKCEVSLFIFTLLRNKNFSNTLDAILASYSANTKKYKTMNESLQLCKIVCRRSNVEENDWDFDKINVTACHVASANRWNPFNIIIIILGFFFSIWIIIHFTLFVRKNRGSCSSLELVI